MRTLRSPFASSLVLAIVYVAIGVFSLYLLVSLNVWWPLMPLITALAGAVGCVVTAIRRRLA